MPTLTPPFEIDDLIELDIKELTYNGGRGLGRYENFVVFVPLVKSKDRVKVKITGIKKNFASGELIETLSHGPGHRSAPCPHFGKCGGCEWQHLDYETQAQAKQDILKNTIRGLLQTEPCQLQDFEQAPNEWNYRNRIQLHPSENGWGYFQRGSSEVEPIRECLIAEKELLGLLSDPRLEEFQEKDFSVEFYKDFSGQANLRSRKASATNQLFGQVNSAMNERLIADLLQFISGDEKSILELFCGSGNLSFPLMEKASRAEFTGVELSREAIDTARSVLKTKENINRRAKFAAQNCDHFLAQTQPRKMDLILLDPPRTGSKFFSQSAWAQKAKRLIYISCNPTTFHRDAQKVLEGSQLRLRWVKGYDLFPQTSHIELMAVFDLDS